MEEHKRVCLNKGLQVGQKIKVGREVNKTWGKTYVVTVNQGVITGLYPYIFTAELKANKNTVEGDRNIIKTSFLYSQVINGEVELWN